jgi:hypothetical protein
MARLSQSPTAMFKAAGAVWASENRNQKAKGKKYKLKIKC